MALQKLSTLKARGKLTKSEILWVEVLIRNVVTKDVYGIPKI